MKLRLLGLCVVMVGLGACEHLPPSWQMNKAQQQQPVAPMVIEELTPMPQANENMEMPTIMSNESVIVYPITGDINNQKRNFAEYRGVVENTTVGGYTVFDPSVTVYAVEGQGMKPSYLPDYSIPQYAAQYRPVPVAPLSMPGEVTMVPSAPPMPLMNAPAPISSRPMSVAPAKTPDGARSGPVLTGY